MKALKAYKYRLYPTSKQEEFIQKTFSCVRLVYNLMLQDRIDIYKEMRKNPQQTFKMPTPAKYKIQYPVLREVDSLALANAQVYLDRAFKNFYREKGMGFPKKKKKETVHSYTTNNQHGTVKILDNRYLKVPKLKSLIKMKVHRQPLGEIKSVTISMSASHNYYVSILCEAPIETKTKQQKMVGICSSREKFALLSNGESFEKSYCSKHLKQKLRQEERKLNKRKMIALEKGVDLSQAKNYQKQKIKVAKIRHLFLKQSFYACLIFVLLDVVFALNALNNSFFRSFHHSKAAQIFPYCYKFPPFFVALFSFQSALHIKWKHNNCDSHS